MPLKRAQIIKLLEQRAEYWRLQQKRYEDEARHYKALGNETLSFICTQRAWDAQQAFEENYGLKVDLQ